MRGPASKNSISDRLLDWQAALIGNPDFQRLVGRIPILRKIAQNRAKDVFDLCAGFVYAQVLTACVELRLLQTLRERPACLEEIALQTRLSPHAVKRLVAAAVSLGLLSWRSGGRVGLGSRGAAIAGNSGILEMIAHHRMLYRDLSDPVALLRGEVRDSELSRYWAYADADTSSCELVEGDVSHYSALMSASQSLVAQAIIDAYPFARHRLMLDVGGGDGTFISHVSAASGELKFQHFDLPPVSTLAREKFQRLGLAGRVRLYPGSFLQDALPEGADLITLVRIVHDHDDPSVEIILARIRAAIAPRGVLLIAEPMAETAGAEAVGDAYFNFYLMAMGQGRARTFEELSKFVQRAGFSGVHEVSTPLPLQTRLLVAQT